MVNCKWLIVNICRLLRLTINHLQLTINETMNQNIFREYDIRGIVGEQLTDETVAILGKAIGTFFRQNGARRITVGYDARISSPRFCEFLTRGFNETGCDAILIGRVPTPVLYHAVFTRET